MDPSAEIEKILIFALDGRPTREDCSKVDKSESAKKGLERAKEKNERYEKNSLLQNPEATS